MKTGALVTASSSALVDIDTSNDTGRPNEVVLEEKNIATVYINPEDNQTNLAITLQYMTINADGVTLEPLSYSVEVL